MNEMPESPPLGIALRCEDCWGSEASWRGPEGEGGSKSLAKGQTQTVH